MPDTIAVRPIITESCVGMKTPAEVLALPDPFAVKAFDREEPKVLAEIAKTRGLGTGTPVSRPVRISASRVQPRSPARHTRNSFSP